MIIIKQIMQKLNMLKYLLTTQTAAMHVFTIIYKWIIYKNVQNNVWLFQRSIWHLRAFLDDSFNRNELFIQIFYSATNKALIVLRYRYFDLQSTAHPSNVNANHDQIDYLRSISRWIRSRGLYISHFHTGNS